MRKPNATPLHNLRRARTMSQQDLARLAHISQQSLSKIERGVLRPSRDVRARLAAILGVSEADAFPARSEGA
jgi:transcriptional regulator with XRE-family HTH domain